MFRNASISHKTSLFLKSKDVAANHISDKSRASLWNIVGAVALTQEVQRPNAG